MNQSILDRFSLKGRTALVTGSSRGIGRAILLALADCGADVIVHGQRPSDQAEATCGAARQRGVRVEFIPADLSEEGSTRELARKALELAGTIDIFVSNTSVQIRKDWLEITSDEFDLQVRTNLHSTLILAQLLVPRMQKQKWGRLLMIGSVQEVVPHRHMAIYAATKNAQTSLVLNLAKQLGPDGITVNNLAPGVIDTDRNAPYTGDPATLKRILNHVPVGFCGQPADCAGAALLLCSDAGRYINGASLYIDGGMSL